MFEKEAEEIVKDYIIKNWDCLMQPCKTLEDCKDKELEFDEVVRLVKDGAEFGYNKANEWHYLKDELPPEDVPILCNRGGNIYVAWFILGKWKGDKYNDVKKPYAWKEIVLPELPKESE